MRDEDTGGHIMRVTEYTRVLCDALLDANMDGYWISFDDSEEIVSCSKLHDIGKIAIPDNVLLKPGKLSDEEFEIIKSHTTEGYKFFKEYYMIDDDVSDTYIIIAQEIAYSHHEKWNGRGYPQGLKEEEIPLSGRIVAIADVYDALTSVRPYKKAFTHEKACEIIIGDSGTHFDPYLIELFKESSDKFKRIREKIS
ncbi:MAG: HD domain-containing protein [Ruminococcus sp.]|nr:HD domain-containing protein [Ruminococcus sp.]